MEKGKRYLIVKELKLHTKPITTACVIQCGEYVGETDKEYIFDTFRARKAVVKSRLEITNYFKLPSCLTAAR